MQKFQVIYLCKLLQVAELLNPIAASPSPGAIRLFTENKHTESQNSAEEFGDDYAIQSNSEDSGKYKGQFDS